jgi:hypothetical protein
MLISFTFGLIWFAFVIKESFAPTPKSDDSKISGLSGEKLSVT